MMESWLGRIITWSVFWFIVLTIVWIGRFIVGSEDYYIFVGIMVFVSSLALMDAMTYIAWKKLHSKKQNVDKIIDDLPIADKIAIIFPVPVHVLDRREIRRSLIITFTIIYIILLFQNNSNQLIEHFTWVYLVMVSFYFGSRALEKYVEAKR